MLEILVCLQNNFIYIFFFVFVGPIVFFDEVESVRQQAKELKKEGVNRIIALGHAGIEMDKTIAREVEGVDIVIGGHTNTFLYNGMWSLYINIIFTPIDAQRKPPRVSSNFADYF